MLKRIPFGEFEEVIMSDDNRTFTPDQWQRATEQALEISKSVVEAATKRKETEEKKGQEESTALNGAAQNHAESV
jgi:hypothetical protein